jgi:intracellular proteinase inhibitor BsuPI
MRRLRGAVLTCGAALLFFPVMNAAAQRPDSLHFTVDAPKTARRGGPVPITLRITNAANHGVDLYLTGRTVTFDIIVARTDGEVVWRRLEHVSSQQILQIKMLAPGETFELKDVWKQTVEPGEYTVQGVLPTDAEPLRTPQVRLRITPR